METDPAGKQCKLLIPIRTPDGTYHQTDEPNPIIVRTLVNLNRDMLLIKFSDNTTAFVFPSEIEVLEEVKDNDTRNDEGTV